MVGLQETRRHILDILKEYGTCTVEDIVATLSERLSRGITTVTVRHHLERLRAENLVSQPQIRRRSGPGRPQYVYSLTPEALKFFPSNVTQLADEMFTQIKRHLPSEQVNVILEGMADEMASHADIPSDAPLDERLASAVTYLNEQGYNAHFEETEDGYMLTTTNCPYERIVGNHDELCGFDLRLMSSILGIVPRFVGNMKSGHSNCQYLVPFDESKL
jgi:predicted ArsR family transcriptional regulator